MKTKYYIELLEEAQKMISNDYLVAMTCVFEKPFDYGGDFDVKTSEIVREALGSYLNTWVRPNIQKVIDELKNNK